MGNDELIGLVFERVEIAEQTVSEEQRYEAYMEMMEQDDTDGVFSTAVHIITRLLLPNG